MVRIYVQGTIDSENALALSQEKLRRQKLEREQGIPERELTTGSDLLNEAVEVWKNRKAVIA